jgi:hypothetical protein
MPQQFLSRSGFFLFSTLFVARKIEFGPGAAPYMWSSASLFSLFV